jgi:hypothetical protein
MGKKDKKRNIDIVSDIIGGEVCSFNDGSCTWIHFENEKYGIEITFDGKGNKFTEIMVSEKIYGIIDEKIIMRVKN